MSLIKHGVLNLAGNFIPALVSLPAYGYLARTLGVESFGIYTLAIIVVGYAGIFDAGLTRAIVRDIAMYRLDEVEQKKIIACGSASILFLGFIAMSIMISLAPFIVELLNVSIERQNEAIIAISVLALAIPIFLLNQVLLSILEGNEKFLQLNIQRSLGSVFVAGIPVVFVYIDQGILFAVVGLFIARVITLIISMMMLKNFIFSAGIKFNKAVFKRLISFGGWSALSGIISPVMVYFDRFILANILGAKYVAFYSAPAELISRGLIVPGAFAGSIFPKLVNAVDENERSKLKFRAYKIVLLICGTGTLVGYFAAKSVMVLWMGEAFSGDPVLVLKVLLVGFFFNSLSQISFSDIQAKGRSKITAMVHMLEIIPYLIALYLLINLYGVVGAAIAWSGRLVFEFFLFFLLSEKTQ